MNIPVVINTHPICTIPLNIRSKGNTETPLIAKAPPTALTVHNKAYPTEEVKTMTIGPIFCHDISRYKLKRDKVITTQGTQKCRGISPILKTTPIKSNDTEKKLESANIPPIKIIREPQDCDTKYVIAPFLL